MAEHIVKGSDAKATPDGKGIERTCVGIVSLAHLKRVLVEIDDDGEPCHEEQKEHHPELLDATPSASQALPEETEETEQQWQTIIDIPSFIVAQVVGQ